MFLVIFDLFQIFRNFSIFFPFFPTFFGKMRKILGTLKNAQTQKKCAKNAQIGAKMRPEKNKKCAENRKNAQKNAQNAQKCAFLPKM